VTDVGRNHADAVTVVAGEICLHQVVGHEPRFVGGAAAGPNDGGSDRSQTLGAVAHLSAQTLRPDVGEVKTTISLEGPTCRCYSADRCNP
jgi:hypothetical protein